MSSEVLGGGVMVGVAAVLWVAYLMPTWTRRRQYLTIERNAVRLQQTMRILAETSEIPQEVRLEANARTVVTQQKLLAQAEEDARVEAKAVMAAASSARRAVAAQAAAERAAAAQVAAVQAAAQRAAQSTVIGHAAARSRRVRRVRALATLVLLGGLLAVTLGLVALVSGGSAVLLAVGAASGVLAFGTLNRLARTSAHARARSVAAGPAVAEARSRPLVGQDFEPVQFEETPVPVQTWTPHPLPRPLHLAPGTVAQVAMASADAAAQLRRAAAEAEVARRADQLQVAVTPLRHTGTIFAQGSSLGSNVGTNVGTRPVTKTGPVAVAGKATAAAPVSRFASMGIVGETEPGMTDLDAVLRRRRAAG
ncbi:hypothetical protein QN357_02400 [Cryobacterium sp. RTC2.1]|uniref:hypothetical protein n=1 Tax=Cryobacterium sp. RTC2.1 TaxID=3048634 RepID=UPI002B239EBF|nr:hypothetical protein [Cryobacterium sp. RTC2.1]MEB0001788.1 hypothetical protein [Cryobacterium sp. RTC2.1]